MIVFDSSLGVPIAKAARASFNAQVDTCLARVENGQLLGGFTFTDYTGRGGSMMCHVAGFRPGWLNRHLLMNAANYAFNHCGCNRLFGQVRATQPKVLAFDLKLGWKEVAFLEGVFPDGGCHIVSMAREDCRWLSLVRGHGGHGEKERTAAA